MDENINCEEEMEKYEKELHKDMEKTFKKKNRHSRFINGAAMFISNMDYDVEIKCKDQIKKYRENVYIDPERDNNVYPIEGKEEVAKQAYRDLEKCTEIFDYMKSDINEIIDFASNFFYFQKDLCRHKCLENMTPNKIPKRKTCLRRCEFYSQQYINTAIEDSLQIFLADKIKYYNEIHKDRKY